MLLALVAVLCGAILGAERERHEKPAGLRTLMLVCLASATFTMIGFVFASASGDSGRVAAQIVAGIGFLGAGAILHGPGLVSGMTTAATIWVTAAIGMTAGAGYPGAALGVSVIARAVLSGVRALEIRALKRGGLIRLTVSFVPDRGKTRARLQRLFSEFYVTVDAVRWSDDDEGEGQVVERLPARTGPVRAGRSDRQATWCAGAEPRRSAMTTPPGARSWNGCRGW